MGPREPIELGRHQPAEMLAIDGELWRRRGGHRPEDRSAAHGEPDRSGVRDSPDSARNRRATSARPASVTTLGRSVRRRIARSTSSPTEDSANSARIGAPRDAQPT